jgi:hypothetical protein
MGKSDQEAAISNNGEMITLCIDSSESETRANRITNHVETEAKRVSIRSPTLRNAYLRPRDRDPSLGRQ